MGVNGRACNSRSTALRSGWGVNARAMRLSSGKAGLEYTCRALARRQPFGHKDGMKPAPVERPRVGLFVTCLVDLIRPPLGFAAAKLLTAAGCDVDVPVQTCCGQPAFNSGDRATTRAIAEQVIAAFEPYDYVVAPSGSCAGMLRVHYSELFAGDPAWAARAEAFAARVHELISFLVDVMGVTRVAAIYDGAVTYHDARSG